MRTSTRLSNRFTTLIAVALIAATMLPGLAPQPARAAGTADLSITMTAGEKHLKYRQNMANTIVVTNLGPDTATGVWIATNESDSINPGTLVCADGTVTEPWELCPLLTLESGESATFSWTVIACCTCCPERVGVTTATVGNDELTLDPNPDNNFSRIDTRFTGKFPK